MAPRYTLIPPSFVRDQREIVDVKGPTGSLLQDLLMQKRPDLKIIACSANRYSAKCSACLEGRAGEITIDTVILQRTADIRQEEAYYKQGEYFVASQCSLEGPQRTWSGAKICSVDGKKCDPQAQLKHPKDPLLIELIASLDK